MFATWGHLVYRFRWVTLVLSGVFLAGSIVAFKAGGTLKNTSPPQTESGRALRLIQDEIPQPGGSAFSVVFASESLPASDSAFGDAMKAALDPLRDDPRITSIRTPADVSPEMAAALISRDGHKALAVIAVKDEFKVARSYFPELQQKVHSDTLRVYRTGNLAINHDFDVYLERDLQRAEFVSLPLAAILLLLVFASVVAALLPLGVGGLAVVGGLAGVFLLARVTDISQYALNVVTLIGLGVAIDYSLFVVNRFREELGRGRTVHDALVTSVATAGRAVTFSGLTVAIGLSGMLFYQGSFIASLGLGGGIVVGLAVLYALTFLPALLAVLGPRVNRLPVPILGRPRIGRGFWHGLATGVMRRPLLVLVPVLALLALAGSPFLQLRLANGDVEMLPPSSESRQGYDLLLQEFPGQDRTQMSVVVKYLDGNPLTARRVADLYDFSRRLEAIPDVLRVESVVNVDPKLSRSDYQALLAGNTAVRPPALEDGIRQSVGQHIVVLSVLTAKAPQGDPARAIVHTIRAEQAPPGSQVLVTGQTAFDIDIVNFILQRTPAAVLFVMLVTYLVLFLLVGSVVLPLKAVVMNLVSISASFGALVWIFQQGHLSSLLNFTAASIDPSIPVILFCIVFGLSMDYEVMLLSRIQEEYRRTGDTTRAVAEGLERSGRLITGAAAIMVAVFAAFGLADVVIIKSIGLGMAIAVAIDATLVRALIVPAIMRLLGSLNWWAPRPLAYLYRRIGFAELPRTAMQPAEVSS